MEGFEPSLSGNLDSSFSAFANYHPASFYTTGGQNGTYQRNTALGVNYATLNGYTTPVSINPNYVAPTTTIVGNGVVTSGSIYGIGDVVSRLPSGGGLVTPAVVNTVTPITNSNSNSGSGWNGGGQPQPSGGGGYSGGGGGGQQQAPDNNQQAQPTAPVAPVAPVADVADVKAVTPVEAVENKILGMSPKTLVGGLAVLAVVYFVIKNK